MSRYAVKINLSKIKKIVEQKLLITNNLLSPK